MTNQIKDRIYLDDKVFELLSTPLRYFFEAHPDIPRFRGMSSSCRRGYVAAWRIRNNVLYLIGFQQVHPDIDINSNHIIARPKTLADWYTGTLHIPLGNILPDHTRGLQRYEKEIHIYIKSGVVYNHEVVHNQYAPSDKRDNISL